MKTFLSLGLFISTIILLSSCEYKTIQIPETPIPDVISFSANVEPIFTSQSCVSCHPGMHKPDLTIGKAYSSLQSVSGYVVKDNPETSLIYTKPFPGGGHAKEYTKSQAATVLKWIQQGAQNN